MNKLAPKQLLALTMVLVVGQAIAAAPTVGLVVAKSTIRIDSSAVTGNATILSGNVLESVGGTSELRLRGGSVVMDTNAKIRVFEDRTELQSGKIQVNGSQLSTDAGEIRIQSGNGSEAVLERYDSDVMVGSLRGSVKVTDREGVLLASLNPGSSMLFSAEVDEQDQGGAGTGSSSPAGKTKTKAKIKTKPGVKMSRGAKVGWGLAGAAAVAVPVAVVATRSSTPPVSR